MQAVACAAADPAAIPVQIATAIDKIITLVLHLLACAGLRHSPVQYTLNYRAAVRETQNTATERGAG